MKANATRVITSALVGIGIALIYLVFLARCFALSDWTNLSELESLILYTQIIRVFSVLIVSRFMRIPPLFSIILFSFEAFLIPLLAPFVIWTNNPYYTTLMGAILTTWLGVSALVLSPYAIYEFAKNMVSETSLTSVMVIAALEVGGMLFLSGVLSTASATISGPSALGTLLLQLGRSQVASLGFSGIASDNLIEFGLVLFYMGMLCYFSLGYAASKIKISESFLIPLAATVIAFVWIFLSSTATSDYLFVFTVPSSIAVALIWGSTRGE